MKFTSTCCTTAPSIFPWRRWRACATVPLRSTRLSKTYSVTGWRVGWAIASPEVTAAIRKVHDFLTVGAAAPLQEAGAVALQFPPEYYTTLASEYAQRRERLLGILGWCRLQLLQTARGVLHHDRYFRVRFSGRCRVREISGHGNWRGCGSRLQFLPRSSGRAHAPPLHILQNRKNFPSCGRTPGQTEKNGVRRI